MLAKGLAVADDRVGPEMAQPVGIRRCHARTTGPALVEQKHPEVLKSTAHPRDGTAGRAGTLETGPSLEEHQKGPVTPVGRRNFAREHGQRLVAPWMERHLEFMLGQP